MCVLDNSIPNSHGDDAEEKVRNEDQRYVNDDEQAACVMLASMSHKFLNATWEYGCPYYGYAFQIMFW